MHENKFIYAPSFFKYGHIISEEAFLEYYHVDDFQEQVEKNANI